MTEEQIRTDEAVERVMSECLNSLTPIEADFIRECLLSEPRKTHAEFSVNWGLPPKAISGVKAHTLAKLKNVLAAKGIFSMGDLL
jgi:hypothetical protein